MRWTAECECGFKATGNRADVQRQAKSHKRETDHRVTVIGTIPDRDYNRARGSGRTFLAGVAQLV